MTEELKPCPFCGAIPECRMLAGDTWAVVCMNHDTGYCNEDGVDVSATIAVYATAVRRAKTNRGSRRWYVPAGALESAKRKAIDEWNRRASEEER